MATPWATQGLSWSEPWEAPEYITRQNERAREAGRRERPGGVGLRGDRKAGSWAGAATGSRQQERDGCWNGVPTRARGLLGQAGSRPRHQPVEKTRHC